jgi:ribosome-binding protein aMBF1 (putative translation factor)
MDTSKKKRLEAAGWRVGNAADFLELSPEEASYVELKLNLSETLRQKRDDEGLSQVELARRVGSSQSRVAKMESGDPTVSVDLLMRTLFAAGATKKEIADAIAKPRRRRSSRARGTVR